MESKPYQREDWLQHEYVEKGRTVGDIAEQFDMTRPGITHWMDKHDIERRGQREAQQSGGLHTDESWLREQYHGEGRSLSDMGGEAGVTAATVLKYMRRYDIPRRSEAKHKKREPASYGAVGRGYVYSGSKHDGEQSRVWIHQLVAIADGADPHKVFSNGDYQCHHKNGVKWDNRPGNIDLLDGREHDELHAAERERATTGEFL